MILNRGDLTLEFFPHPGLDPLKERLANSPDSTFAMVIAPSLQRRLQQFLVARR
jgi:hypothetical protein